MQGSGSPTSFNIAVVQDRVEQRPELTQILPGAGHRPTIGLEGEQKLGRYFRWEPTPQGSVCLTADISVRRAVARRDALKGP